MTIASCDGRQCGANRRRGTGASCCAYAARTAVSRYGHVGTARGHAGRRLARAAADGRQRREPAAKTERKVLAIDDPSPLRSAFA